MLDGDENKNSWWSGWVQTAKQKSENVLNFVKHDLTEFTATMQNDVAYVKEKLTQENATAASEKVKQGMTNILGGLSKVLIVRPPDDDLDSEMIKIIDGQPVVFDRTKARLSALQIDPQTYISDPDASHKAKYDDFVANDFNLEFLKVEISDMLVTNAHVRSIYTQLVPVTVSNVDFWRHYFYKKQRLEDDELKRSQIIKRADEVQKEELGWDEDLDDFSPKSQKSAETKTSFSEPIKSDLHDDAITVLDTRAGQDETNNACIGSCTDSKVTKPAIDNKLSINASSEAGKDVEGESVVDCKAKVDILGVELETEMGMIIINDEVSASDDTIINNEDNIDLSMAPPLKENKYNSLVDKIKEIELISEPRLSVETSLANIPPPLAASNLDKLCGGPLLVDAHIQSSSSSTSPTSWTNLSTGRNSKEENSMQSSPVGSDTNDKSDGLADDWEKDFDVAISEHTQSTINIQILSTPNPSREKSDDWEDW